MVQSSLKDRKRKANKIFLLEMVDIDFSLFNENYVKTMRNYCEHTKQMQFYTEVSLMKWPILLDSKWY